MKKSILLFLLHSIVSINAMLNEECKKIADTYNLESLTDESLDTLLKTCEQIKLNRLLLKTIESTNYEAEDENLITVMGCIFRGASLETRNKNGATVLQLAATHKKRLAILEFFVKKGSNIEALNKDNFTALHFAVNADNVGAVIFLIRQHANKEARSKKGVTPLILASREGNIKSVEILIKNCVNINAATYGGSTSLMLASEEGHFDVVKLLVENGADIFIKNNQYLTAFDIAFLKGHTEIATYLQNVKNEFKCFKKNPTKWTVAAPLIPRAPKSAYLKNLCSDTMYRTNLNYSRNIIKCVSMFQKYEKTKELKKILNECNFLLIYNKEQRQHLRRSDLPLTANELDIQLITHQLQKIAYKTDLFIE